ncbi:curli fiber membrane-associated lipoprotein CsgG [Stutzerimonas stutzeri CCUG 29243]|jgi:curli production assembly/transport component CsgG|uniref:Curli production assembly/transport component CsgG n=3 Tax=Stutzerimonas stutzeri subgroup TaxID=578833 RepID=M2URH5_STUST|nr:curli fiber membrane-associated lipoprotein CsgG [Stutzerimonas stutzeri CCUG 29243]EME01230.1 curli fiber membrane-associated lipoprotein CsgG [Stutzerimonas stutzeri NF13]|tara:strand:- start:3520 stop:4323 length:804 start_codon:yes stop_codon:yes gene_type:complete
MMAVLQGCAVREPMSADQHPPTLTPRTSTYQDLLALPRPKGPLVAAVYGFRDQTGQYKPTPASSFSTAVTQGAASMLVDAMQASGWFVVLEREGLQNVLTERKIIRASQAKPDVAPNIQSELPSLLAANIIMEGAIVAYETNVRSGGQGARYLGIGLSQEYRVDQVTVNLRAIDVRSGRVLSNVMTTKTIFSVGRSANVYKFIEFKELLEAEAGYTTNEPAQLCVLSAIEAAVAHLIAQGVDRRLWQTAEGSGGEHPALSKYLSKLD